MSEREPFDTSTHLELGPMQGFPPLADKRVTRSNGLNVPPFTACEEPRDLTFFENPEQCRSAAEFAEFSPEDCDGAFKVALVEHETQAPRYDSLALFEEQHGGGVCARPEVAGGRRTTL